TDAQRGHDAENDGTVEIADAQHERHRHAGQNSMGYRVPHQGQAAQHNKTSQDTANGADHDRRQQGTLQETVCGDIGEELDHGSRLTRNVRSKAPPSKTLFTVPLATSVRSITTR